MYYSSLANQSQFWSFLIGSNKDFAFMSYILPCTLDVESVSNPTIKSVCVSFIFDLMVQNIL